MSKADEKSKQYRDFREQCGIKDPVMLNEIEEAYFEGYHQAEEDLHKSIYKAGVLDGFEDAVEGQYEKGYEQAEKDLELGWEDISIIRQIMFDYNRQVRNEMSIPNNEDYCKEVLKRFKEQKGE